MQSSDSHTLPNSPGGLSLAGLIQKFLPYIQKRISGISISGLDMDDLMQEGLIGLFKALENFDTTQDTQFSTYAITCINNCIATAVRSAARKKHLPLRGYLSLDQDDSSFIDGSPSPEEITIAAEGYAALQATINDTLSDFEREVLALYLEGLDYVAVAKQLGVVPKSVDNALQRIRKKLGSRR